ncbi:MAG: hypothetical protein FWD75_05710 [Propionibacteriaceae bacterium]|nr:hypothetical protein [Propionibacteriaceae bacterium]
MVATHVQTSQPVCGTLSTTAGADGIRGCLNMTLTDNVGEYQAVRAIRLDQAGYSSARARKMINAQG